jgi:hypothetical protein
MSGGGGGIQSDEWSHNFVQNPNHGKRLGEKISHVSNTGNVLDPEPATLDPVLKPVEAHVARLRHLGLDGPVGKAHGDFIIAMNRRGRLRVAEVRENLTLEVRNLCSGKRAPILLFLNGRTQLGYTRGVNGDGGVEQGEVVASREMVERPGHAASVGPGQVRWSRAERFSCRWGARIQNQGGGPGQPWSQAWRWSLCWPAHSWRSGRDRRRIDHNKGDSLSLSLSLLGGGGRWRGRGIGGGVLSEILVL